MLSWNIYVETETDKEVKKVWEFIHQYPLNSVGIELILDEFLVERKQRKPRKKKEELKQEIILEKEAI